jgi:hypothetical protein
MKTILKLRPARPGEIGLFPDDARGFEVFNKLKNRVGKDVKTDVSFARNTRQLRLFWVIVDFVEQHCDLFEDVVQDNIAEALKIATGLVRNCIDIKTGEVTTVVRSMAEDKLDQETFDEFFQKACRVIAERWMPAGTTPESVRAELLRKIDGPRAIGSRVA